MSSESPKSARVSQPHTEETNKTLLLRSRSRQLLSHASQVLLSKSRILMVLPFTTFRQPCSTTLKTRTLWTNRPRSYFKNLYTPCRTRATFYISGDKFCFNVHVWKCLTTTPGMTPMKCEDLYEDCREKYEAIRILKSLDNFKEGAIEEGRVEILGSPEAWLGLWKVSSYSK